MGAGAGFSNDKEWSSDVKLQVFCGLLQEAGLLPRKEGSNLAAMIGGATAPTVVVPETKWTELGRDICRLAKDSFNQGLSSPVTGGPLWDPGKIGYYIIGQEPSAIGSIMGAVGETVETLSGGLLSPDDGGLDADALGILLQLGTALAA